MAQQRLAHIASPAGDGEGLSPLLWLALPLGAAAVLLLFGRPSPGTYVDWTSSERGPVEIAQVLVVLAGLAAAISVLRLPRVRADRWLRAWFGLAALGCFYIAGEEVSWGQQILNWSTPGYWQELNDQNETNLHNTSVWLDQRPRSLLELGVIVGGIVLPLVRRWRPGLLRGRYAVLIPPLALLPSAVLAELARLPARLSGAFDRSWHLFQRGSEVQELYFYLFVLLYLVAMHRRLGAASDSDRGG